MPTITSTFENASEYYFLVDIDGRYRYASKNIQVSDTVLFKQKILNEINIGRSFDFESFRFSITNVSITVDNSDSLQNIKFLEKKDVTIYIWCEGLTWAQTQTQGVVFKGFFETTSYDKFKYNFNAVEKTRSGFDTLPKNTINSDTFANYRTSGGQGSVAGKAQPLAFGDYASGVPLLPVDTSSYYYLISSHSVKSDSSDFGVNEYIYDKDGVAISSTKYTKSFRVDGVGNAVSIIDFTTAMPTASEPLTCSVRGINYTIGTEDILLQNPADIIQFIVDKHSTLNISKGAFATSRALFAGYKINAYINSQTNGVDIVDRILAQCLAGRITDTNGNFGVVVFNIDPIIKTALNLDRESVGKSYNITKTSETLLCNDVLLRYNRQPNTGNFQGIYNLNRFNSRGASTSYKRYGAYPQKILDLPDVADFSTALAIGAKYLSIYGNRHDIVEVLLPYQTGFLIKEWQGVNVTADVPGWTSEKCILLERKLSRTAVTCKFWRINVL